MIGNVMNISHGGFKIIESKSCVDFKQVQRRKHKKKRINKKWLKRYGEITKTVPSDKIYIFDNVVSGHPVTIAKLIKAIQKTK